MCSSGCAGKSLGSQGTGWCQSCPGYNLRTMLVTHCEWKEQKMEEGEGEGDEGEQRDKIREDKNKVNEDREKIPPPKNGKTCLCIYNAVNDFTRGALQDSIKTTECYHQYHYRVGRNQYCP